MPKRTAVEPLCCPPVPEPANSPLAIADTPETDEELAALSKALSHPVRVRIVRMLARKEARMCSHIVDELPLAH